MLCQNHNHLLTCVYCTLVNLNFVYISLIIIHFLFKYCADAFDSELQSRVSTPIGTNNITNVLQDRYNVVGGDTEQLLRYTKNFASIASTKWSVPDESVATIDENGNKKWTFTFTVTESGEQEYSIVFADKDGNLSDAVMTETIYVDEAPETAEPDADDTPENDSADNESSNPIGNFFERLVAFILRLVELWRSLW